MDLVTVAAEISIGCVVLAFFLICMKTLEYWTQHKDEPPILGDSVPFVTPLLGILKDRTNFMVQMR